MSVILQNGLLRQEQLILGQYRVLQPTVTILLVNLMPNRQQTEQQFAQLLAQLPFNVRLTFAVPATHVIKHDRELIEKNYVTLADIWQRQFDGLIVTGAPVDQEKVAAIDYWDEFQQLLAWRHTHVKESLLTCWAAYGAGYVERNFPVRHVKDKIFGVYHHQPTFGPTHPLLAQMPDFAMPHSRYFTIPNRAVAQRLKVAGDDRVGAFILRDDTKRTTYLTGHLEYATHTLHDEFLRDQQAGQPTLPPENYYQAGEPVNAWAATAGQFFKNWGHLLLKQAQRPAVVELIPAMPV